MTLVPVQWDGLELSTMNNGSGVMLIVEDVTGWYGTPEPDTGDINRSLTDGSLLGLKTIRAREIVISGKALGPREALLMARDGLARRTVARYPAALTITDPWLKRPLTADVRASSALEHEFLRETAFRYQVTLTAPDPRLYAEGWQTTTMVLIGTGTTTAGRLYPRTYPWNYGTGVVPGQGQLTNLGNAPAPVTATYDGPLSETRLTDGVTTVRIAPLLSGEQIQVELATLSATAPGGAARGGYVLAGSAPLWLPARSTVTWQLLGTGLGTVTLSWRSAWV